VPGFTKRERTEAQIAVYGNMVEALMDLMDAAEQLGDGQHLQTMGEDVRRYVTVIQEQSSIIGEYWKILRPFYKGRYHSIIL